MTVKSLSPEKAFKSLEITKISISPTSILPKEITDLKEEIEGEIRVAELRFSVTGIIDQAHFQEIIGMKLRFDGLYIDWAEGKIP